MMKGVAADRVGEPAEDYEEARTEEERPTDERRRSEAIDLKGAVQEEEHIELARVPDDRLAGDKAEERYEANLFDEPPKALGQWRLRRLALRLHSLEHRRLVELRADPDRDVEQHEQKHEGHTPAPDLEGLLVDHGARPEDHDERKNETRVIVDTVLVHSL